MEPTQQIDTLEDLMDDLIAEGETVALQKLRRMIIGAGPNAKKMYVPEGESIVLGNRAMLENVIIMSGEEGKENEDGTGQGT